MPVGDVPTEPPRRRIRTTTRGCGPATAARPRALLGLAIASVPPGSIRALGLRPGDVIRSVNGEAVMSEADVARILQGPGLQGPLTAEVQRGGVTIPVVVGQQR
jgi:S1-C subfamily serine protease